MKTVTSATALELLGEDYRFETTVEYDGELRPDGILEGNLYIRGSGDPTLNSSESRTPKDSMSSTPGSRPCAQPASARSPAPWWPTNASSTTRAYP